MSWAGLGWAGVRRLSCCCREVLSELQPKINKYFTASSDSAAKPGKAIKMFAPLPAASLPWNYGFSGCKAKGLSTPRHLSHKLCQDAENNMGSVSMMEIHELDKLARRSNMMKISNLYLDM